MRVLSISYKPVEGGSLGGHFALHVTLGGGDTASVFSPAQLASKIHDSIESLGIKAKIKGVLIDCREAKESSEDMISLLGVLKDWGLFINLWVAQDTRYPWFEYASFITVFVTSPRWPNFRVSEIRYIPPSNMIDWTEPEVYDVNAQAACYVEFSKPMSQAVQGGNVVAFLTSCKRPWGLIGWNVAITFKLGD